MSEPTYELLRKYAEHANEQLKKLQAEGKLSGRPYEWPGKKDAYAVSTNEHMYARFTDATGFEVEVDIYAKGPHQSALVTITRLNEDFELILRSPSKIILKDVHSEHILDIDVTQHGVVEIEGGKPGDLYDLTFGDEEAISTNGWEPI